MVETDSPASTPKRTKIACDECRKNKRKCDGQRPTCSLCLKGRRACEYTLGLNERKRKRDEADYIQALEEQVKTLTALVHANGNGDENRLRGLVSPENTSGDGVQSPAPEPSYQELHASAQEQSRSSGRSVDPQSHHLQMQTGPDQRSTLAMEDLGLMMLRMGIEDEGEPSFTIATGTRNAHNSSGRRNELPAVASSPDTTIDLRVLHDVELRRHLMRCFWQYFNPFHQVLVQSDAWNLEREQYASWTPDEQLRNIAVFAVGAHFSDLPEARELGEQCAEHAENMILHCLKHYPSDLLVQGLSLLAWRDLSLGNDSMSWNFNSSATGLALRLGIHVTGLSQPNDTLTPTALEIHKRRIRSFWVYFSIDRIVTSILGMNCTMPWQRVRVVPFSAILGTNRSVDEIAFCRQGQLWHLWDTFMDQTYAFDWSSLSPSGKDDLLLRSQSALFSFHQDSDPVLRSLAPSAVCYQLAFHAAVILIHRPFFSEPVGTPTLPIALQAGTDAALKICRILRDVKKSSTLVDYPPYIVNYIVCAAVIHLMNATCGKTSLGRRSANNLKTCMYALGDMDRRWKFRQDTAIRFVQEIAHKWKVVWALPIQFSAPLTMTGEEPRRPETTEIGSQGAGILPFFDFWQSGPDANPMNRYQGVIDYFDSTHDVSELERLFDTDV